MPQRRRSPAARPAAQPPKKKKPEVGSRGPGIALCALAGLAAALASVFGKLALSDFLALPEQSCERLGVADLCYHFATPLLVVPRAVSLGMLVASNVVMHTAFTRAMHLSSSFVATVATTSFNFSFTAILSMAIFGETLPPLWWAGFSCILIGLALLTTAPRKTARAEGSAQTAATRQEGARGRGGPRRASPAKARGKSPRR